MPQVCDETAAATGSPLDVALAHVGGVDRGWRRSAVRFAATLAHRLIRPDGQARLGLPAALTRRLRRLADRRTGRAAVYYDPSTMPKKGAHALLVSHELSVGGAPRTVADLAEIFLASGFGVTVLAPADGAFRNSLVEAGVVVVIDGDLLTPHAAIVSAMAAVCDFAICNTVVSAPAVATLSPLLPTFWYIHEISLLRDMLAADSSLSGLFAAPRAVWAGSELSAAVVRPHRPDVKVLPYGLDPILRGGAVERAPSELAKIAVFGSIEPRKGQDLVLEAVASLSPAQRGSLSISLFGPVLDSVFHARLSDALQNTPEVAFCGELDQPDYRAAVLDCDAVLVSSRDDTLPLVSLDALGAGRVLMCTATTGTSAYIRRGVDGFVADDASAASIAAMLSTALARRDDWPAIGDAGRALFARAFSKEAFARRLRTEIGLGCEPTAGEDSSL